MDNHRQDLVVIVAGYRDGMDQFFQSNPGMSTRIADQAEDMLMSRVLADKDSRDDPEQRRADQTPNQRRIVAFD